MANEIKAALAVSATHTTTDGVISAAFNFGSTTFDMGSKLFTAGCIQLSTVSTSIPLNSIANQVGWAVFNHIGGTTIDVVVAAQTTITGSSLIPFMHLAPGQSACLPLSRLVDLSAYTTITSTSDGPYLEYHIFST